jgi:hypothetical protein
VERSTALGKEKPKKKASQAKPSEIKSDAPAATGGRGTANLPPFSDPALADMAARVLREDPARPRDSRGDPGGLIDLPPGKRPLIIGDLHSCHENLSLILDHGENRADLEAGRAYILFLGDILHDDRTGHMRETESSIEILNRVLTLIVSYPGSVFYIRGNHDTFDERLRKSGVPQGAVFREALIASAGQAFADAVGRWFESLPYVACGPEFMVVHAGPVRGGCVREEIIEIWRRPDYAMQFCWNRVNEYLGNPSPKEYCERDIRATLECLGYPDGSHFIVGHNPLWNDGGRTGLWRDVIGIKNHHILYSGFGSRAPYATVRDGAFTFEFAMPKEKEVIYYG